MSLINENLANILKEIPAIAKKEKGSLNYNFRGVDSVFNALHGLFSAHSVFIRSEILNVSHDRFEAVSSSGKLQITHVCRIMVRYHLSTTDDSTTFTDGFAEAFDFSDKAAFKAQSMALKYALISMFLIPTQEVKDVEVADIQRATIGEDNTGLIASVNLLLMDSKIPAETRQITANWLNTKNPNAAALLKTKTKLESIINA